MTDPVADAIRSVIDEVHPTLHPVSKERLLQTMLARPVIMNSLLRDGWVKPEMRRDLAEIVDNVTRESPELTRAIPSPDRLVALEEKHGRKFRDLEKVTRLRELQDPVAAYELAATLRAKDAESHDAAALLPAHDQTAPRSHREAADAILAAVGSDSAVKRQALMRSLKDAERLPAHAEKVAGDIVAKGKKASPRDRLTAHRLAVKAKKG